MIKKLITTVIRNVNSKNGYRLAPLSTRFGFDRGTPIDRYWIENFLAEHQALITGNCLEVTDNTYTKRFGMKVHKSDVLDINPKNGKANIISDLRDLKNVKDNSYDCIVLTHVLGLIDDLPSAVTAMHRVLKPGGSVLITTSCFSPDYDHLGYWRFTPNALRFLFDKRFSVDVRTYGNVLAGQAFWVGMAQEELTKEQLNFNDPRYPCIVAMRATKK